MEDYYMKRMKIEVAHKQGQFTVNFSNVGS